MRVPRRLRRSELPANTIELATFLLGKTVVHDMPEGRVSGRIVEVEAYPVGDSAGHAFRGRTPRNGSLFLERGHAYVYISYGTSRMLNVSSESPDVGAGVLIRAVEPLEGIEFMEGRRGTQRRRDLTRGPGRLAQAMAIDLNLDGMDLCDRSPLWLGSETQAMGKVGESVRIGLTRETERILRFYEAGNPFVSGPSRLCR
jgi:DNA-3-methyladenine glycosylase